MAIAIASCASGESAPNDMPALSKRFKMDDTDSTCSSGTGVQVVLSLNMSRNVLTGRSLTRRAKSSHRE